MANTLRREILHCFKSLHQARKTVFEGDSKALMAARQKINEEFKKNKHVQNEDAVQELMNYSKAVEQELRSCVIQAEEVSPGRFQAKITEETVKLDNIPFKEECCSNVDSNKPRRNDNRGCG